MSIEVTTDIRSLKQPEPRATDPIFSPDANFVEQSQLTAFVRHCERETTLTLANYPAFYKFSVTEFRLFWRLFLGWSSIAYDGDTEPVCVGDVCEQARFFPKLLINYAEILLRENGDPDRAAITACHFNGKPERLTRKELRVRVERLAAFLQHTGVRPGDRIVVIARNGAEAIIAALAAASIGAVFSSCAPDMGVFAILSRFTSLEPLVLMGHLRTEQWDSGTAAVANRLAEVAKQLPTLKTIIALDDGLPPDGLTVPVHRFTKLIANDTLDEHFVWHRFSFNHPLFILFSSGTTGSPKCIVHGAGGTLLEHVKEHRLHCDLRPGDKLFFQTSCAWMMWNWQLTALASGVDLVLYDGPLKGPDTLWHLVAENAVTVFGTSPAYLHLSERAGFAPRRAFDLASLRSILSTGSILYPQQYDWVRAHVKELPLQSISGGTDIVGCFVLGNPNLPVHRGEAQCRSLGLDVRSLPPADEPNGPIGELICANPFPSRPLGFYGEGDGKRFHAAYFSQNPGVWTHGDLIEFTTTGGARLHGRSDGVFNVRGIRVGPADIYSILQDIDEILEAMAVEQRAENELGGSRMVLLVVLRDGAMLDDELVLRIRSKLAKDGSPVMVPGRVAQVNALPITHSGKRSEAAARDALNGRAVRNRASLQNPECLEAIASHPALRPTTRTPPPRQESRSVISREHLEVELQQICSEVLELKSIKASDNFFETGVDSLAILNILLGIEERLGRRLPYMALFYAPTIADLAKLMLDSNFDANQDPDFTISASRLTDTATAAGVQIRPTAPPDIESICHLLHEGFKNEAISADAWRSLFDNKWRDEKQNSGFVLVDDDEIVGFIGTIYAKRRINDKAVRTCNLTSYYVRREYRGWGVPLLATAVQDGTIAYTALTPGPVTRKILKSMGFGAVGTSKILLPPFFHVGTLYRPAPTITFDRSQIDDLLTDKHRQIFYDHLPYNCLQAVVSDGLEYCYLVGKRRVRRVRLRPLVPVVLEIPYTELLYCSAPHLLLRHLERIKLALMREQRTAALVVDEHCLPALRPRGIKFRNESLYRAPFCDERGLDGLYSELVMLPL